jgi:hypothetical protein
MVPIGQEAGWAPELVLWRRERSAPVRNCKPDTVSMQDRKGYFSDIVIPQSGLIGGCSPD